MSPAAALIPFLEHDDANRALMGSNMQRQAVPLLVTEAPLVGTGLEDKVAEDSGALVLARRSGVVEFVSGEMIAVRYERDPDEVPVDYSEQPNLDIYRLIKFRRSNQDTCLNQRPTVLEGQKVKKGQVIADGPATREGELALGRNVLVAFMPWGGYNFEDAILVSEKLIKDDIFTSIHIEEFELQVRDTKRGVEEITREIPNVSEEAVKNLDEEGIIRIGARVRQGDILVGKVTPKGEQELSPEERLLKAIFGDKAGDVRDASLKAPPGMDGIVIDIKVFSRREKDEGTKQQEKKKIEKLRRESKKERERIADVRLSSVSEILLEQTVNVLRSAGTGEAVARKGRKYTPDFLEEMDFDDLAWGTPVTEDERINERFWAAMEGAQNAFTRCERELEKEIEKVTRGDELPPGVVKLVKVYIAKKRKLSVGDKMAGRHGNKGVVAKILAEEDMPYLPDGTPVEIVLNPLGVPSRMNIGQVLETHLGWAAHALGYTVATPVFAGATVDEIKAELREAGLPEDGKSVLRDGRTGEPFDNRVTVGFIYMLKLSHLVDDKIHARSTGPYSLVTQQPLGGKAQFGGQRFGEMEVWALEAYGAAYTLQEMLTVKSDDVAGRSRIYEAIVKGENPPEPGCPSRSTCWSRNSRACAWRCSSRKSEPDLTASGPGPRRGVTATRARSVRGEWNEPGNGTAVAAQPGWRQSGVDPHGRARRAPARGLQLDADPPRVSRHHPELVARRGDQAGDHQLPVLQAGEGRAVLREDLRPGQGLGVQLRQVQADPLPRRDLRPLRRRGDPGQGAARADGAHRAGRAGRRTSGSSRACPRASATCST